MISHTRARARETAANSGRLELASQPASQPNLVQRWSTSGADQQCHLNNTAGQDNLLARLAKIRLKEVLASLRFGGIVDKGTPGLAISAI